MPTSLMTSRTVRHDCDLHGIQMKRGEKVGTLAVIADRDPAVYQDADDVKSGNGWKGRR